MSTREDTKMSARAVDDAMTKGAKRDRAPRERAPRASRRADGESDVEDADRHDDDRAVRSPAMTTSGGVRQRRPTTSSRL
jgi:hypothetical protein